MAERDAWRLGPIAVKKHRWFLWLWVLRTSKTMWVLRAELRRGLRDFLVGVSVFRDDDGDLNVDVGLFPFRWHLTGCPLTPTPSETLRAWAEAG